MFAKKINEMNMIAFCVGKTLIIQLGEILSSGIIEISEQGNNDVVKKYNINNSNYEQFEIDAPAGLYEIRLSSNSLNQTRTFYLN